MFLKAEAAAAATVRRRIKSYSRENAWQKKWKKTSQSYLLTWRSQSVSSILEVHSFTHNQKITFRIPGSVKRWRILWVTCTKPLLSVNTNGFVALRVTPRKQHRLYEIDVYYAIHKIFARQKNRFPSRQFPLAYKMWPISVPSLGWKTSIPWFKEENWASVSSTLKLRWQSTKCSLNLQRNSLSKKRKKATQIVWNEHKVAWILLHFECSEPLTIFHQFLQPFTGTMREIF